MSPRAARRNLGKDPKEGEQVKSDGAPGQPNHQHAHGRVPSARLREVFDKLDIRSRVDLAGSRWSKRGPRRRKPHDRGM